MFRQQPMWQKAKAKLSFYRSIFIPTLIYGHEGWVMTKINECSPEGGWHLPLAIHKVKSSVIAEGRRIEPLLPEKPVEVVWAPGKDVT